MGSKRNVDMSDHVDQVKIVEAPAKVLIGETETEPSSAEDVTTPSAAEESVKVKKSKTSAGRTAERTGWRG